MPLPYRIEWLDEAKADVRRVEGRRPCACSMAFFTTRARVPAILHPLHGDMAGAFRLRLGDYRVLFTLHDDAMRIFGIRNRREAYR